MTTCVLLGATPRPTLCVGPCILSRSDNCHYLTAMMHAAAHTNNHFYSLNATFSLTKSHKLHNAKATGQGYYQRTDTSCGMSPVASSAED